MRVRAKNVGSDKWVGYYNLVRRKAGNVFDLLDNSHFSEKWMEKVNGSVEKTPAPGEPSMEALQADGMLPVKKKPGRPKANAVI